MSRPKLDPPKNAKAIKVGAKSYEGTAMTNGWMAVYRQEGALFAEKTIVVFDLLSRVRASQRAGFFQSQSCPSAYRLGAYCSRGKPGAAHGLVGLQARCRTYGGIVRVSPGSIRSGSVIPLALAIRGYWLPSP